MKNLIDFTIQNANAIYIIIILLIIIDNLYNKIKFECLKKACEKIATVESHKELTGEEKFAMVMVWINDDLPSIFKNSFVQNIIKTIVQYAYNNSSIYMKNYIKRKTGLDISDVIKTVKEKSEN